MFSYNPGVRDMSGQLLAQGISQAFQGASAGLQEYRQKQELRKQDEAAIQYLTSQGIVKNEAEAKAAVKGMGGGPRAIQAITAAESLKAQQEQAQRQAEAERLAVIQAEQARQARLAALGPVAERRPNWSITGQSPTRERDPYQDEAVAAYMRRTGGEAPDKATLDALKLLPGRPEAARPREDPRLLNFGRDNAGRPIQGIEDANRNLRMLNEGRETGPASTQGKLLADADALAAQGRPEEAAALRQQAMQGADPRISDTQRGLIASRRDRLGGLYDKLDELDEEIKSRGSGLTGGRRRERERLLKEINQMEDSLQRVIDSARQPLAPVRGAQGGATTAATTAGAPGSRPRAENPQTGEIVEWDGQAWVPVR
jgi:hypothetical protein